MHVEAKLEELGLTLPEPASVPPGVQASFAWVRVYGDRVYVSRHGPLAPDGTPAGPFGQVGADVSPEQGYEAARSTALAVLSSLKRELVSLTVWYLVDGARHGQRRAWVRPNHERDQRFLRSDRGALRDRGRDARAHGAGRGGSTAGVSGCDWGRAGDKWLVSRTGTII